MKTIYLVSKGDYSDYSIEGVFDTKEGAEAYCALDKECSIEEYELNALEEVTKRAPAGLKSYSCHGYLDRKDIYVYTCDPIIEQFNVENGMFSAFIWAKDQKEAEKIIKQKIKEHKESNS